MWDRKTWYKATQHLWSTHTAHPARKDLPPPSPEVHLGTLVSDRRPNGTYLVKLDEHPDEVECNLGNLARYHPLTSVAADPAWAEAETLRRSEAEAAAAASAVAMADATTGPRKHGRKPGFRQQLLTAEGRSAAPGVGTAQGGLRPQRNTLEGRCRTVLARLLRSETTTNLGKVQEMLREDELKDGATQIGGAQKDDRLVTAPRFLGALCACVKLHIIRLACPLDARFETDVRASRSWMRCRRWASVQSARSLLLFSSSGRMFSACFARCKALLALIRHFTALRGALLMSFTSSLKTRLQVLAQTSC